MAFQSAIDALSQVLEQYAWVGELAGILPLSALIDFIEVPPKLHILELVGRVPIWSWIITPSGSRLLLSEPAPFENRDCCQDRFGATAALEVLDGYYGDRYFAASPETLRLVLGSLPCIEIENDHENTSTARLASQVRRALIVSENMASAEQYAYILRIIMDSEYDSAPTLRKQLLSVMGIPEAIGRAGLKEGPGMTGNHETTDLPNTAGLYQSLDIELLKSELSKNPAASDPRTQVLEVAYVSRLIPDSVPVASPGAWWRAMFRNICHVAELPYLVTVALGWTLLLGTLVASAILDLWISFAFCLLVPFTGLAVHAMYGTKPRQLLVDKPSKYNRLLLITEHMNSAGWTVVIGESTIVNSLLNRPLHPSGSSPSINRVAVYRFLLRVCIIGQWALVLGAVATKNWDAYFICFWLFFSIISHCYLATPKMGARAWLRLHAKLQIHRFRTSFTSRRALLNTIIALNPDSFSHNDAATNGTQQSMKWLDPILKPSEGRSRWEKATREAMKALNDELEEPGLDLKQHKYRAAEGDFLNRQWRDSYTTDGDYWSVFIPEGIYVAAKIKKMGNIPRARVSAAVSSQQIV